MIEARGQVSKSQRRKGASGELEACRLLNDEFGTAVSRNLSQTRDSGTDIHGVGEFAIEVKRRARIAGLYEWIAQADRDDKTPVLMVRADGRGWLVTMRFSDWARLAREEIAK